MAVKHKVVECVESCAEARLALILRALQNINAENGVQGFELAKVCETLVVSLGTIPIPNASEDYLKFMEDVQNVQDILAKACSSKETISILKALYNCISNPSRQRQPTMSIVLQLIDVDSIPMAVKWILHSGCKEQSLEEALMTLCNWLSRWTFTPNLGPLVLCFMQGLESEQHYEILVDVSLKYIERLFKLLNIAEPRQTVGPVVLHMLSSIQHTPAAFHKIIPHVGTILHSLYRENSKASLSYLKEIVILCVALMEHFPGHSVMYEPLTRTLQPFNTVLNCKPMLKCKSWLDEPTLFVTTQFTIGKVGLNNLGNTCYMNSVLQALFMTKLFRNDILLIKKESLPLFSKLQILFALLQHSQRSSLSPSDILHLSRPPGFQPGHQHDSSEFLGYLLDILHEQEKTVEVTATASEAPSSENAFHGTTVVQRSFGGRAVTLSRCGNCETQSERADNFRELQLSFPTNYDNHQSVQTLLDYYLQPEKLWGDNQYHCDTCHGLTDGERVTRVVEPPPRLVLTLKNFRYDPASQQRTKLLQRVTLDASIQLEGAHYELYAAVVHCGSSLDSGHYYTFARDNDDWYKFNDCVVTQSNTQELCGIRPPETPYILFYSKQDCLDPETLPRSSLSLTLENIISSDTAELETERRRRPVKTYPNRQKRDDEPPPPGCGGGGFMSNTLENRYIC